MIKQFSHAVFTASLLAFSGLVMAQTSAQSTSAVRPVTPVQAAPTQVSPIQANPDHAISGQTTPIANKTAKDSTTSDAKKSQAASSSKAKKATKSTKSKHKKHKSTKHAPTGDKAPNGKL
jgi:hypothetical protein